MIIKSKLDIIIDISHNSSLIHLPFTSWGHFSLYMNISIDINELRVRWRINGKPRKKSYLIFNYIFLLDNVIIPRIYTFQS